MPLAATADKDRTQTDHAEAGETGLMDLNCLAEAGAALNSTSSRKEV